MSCVLHCMIGQCVSACSTCRQEGTEGWGGASPGRHHRLLSCPHAPASSSASPCKPLLAAQQTPVPSSTQLTSGGGKGP